MVETNRIRNSRLNISANMTIYILQALFSFAVRTLFIKKLGAELLGLDSLLINILSALSLAELGISTAINYCLYKPLAENKIKKINAYMYFYKKVYHSIGYFVLFVGLILLLFLKKIVGDVNYSYLYLVYLIYLINTVSLYFISYKEVLLTADQKNYKIFKYNCFFNNLIYVLQFILLWFYPNYILYLIIMVCSRIINWIFVNRFITKYYPDVDFHSKERLSPAEISKIKTNIFGLFCIKIGEYAINSTDNIIISSIINVATVGIYTNYLSITTILKTIIARLFDGLTASFGNLAVEKNKEAEMNVFKIMTFISFLVTGYVTLCFLNLINPFIQVWLGEKYILPFTAMIIICINFYFICNQLPLDTIKQAKGFYKKDKYIPIIQAIINILVSIILGNVWGIYGILIGTSISYITTVFWNKPYILYKYIFKQQNKNYFLDQIKYIITLTIMYIITWNLFRYLNLSVSIISLIIEGILITLLYLLSVTLLFYRREEYQFLIQFVKQFFSKKEMKE